MNAREWIDAFAATLDTAPPTSEEFATLLDLAGEAAHSSERVAAPVACWVAATAGVEPHQALSAARELDDSRGGRSDEAGGRVRAEREGGDG